MHRSGLLWHSWSDRESDRRGAEGSQTQVSYRAIRSEQTNLGLGLGSLLVKPVFRHCGCYSKGGPKETLNHHLYKLTRLNCVLTSQNDEMRETQRPDVS